jgi:hypothetical protein
MMPPSVAVTATSAISLAALRLGRSSPQSGQPSSRLARRLPGQSCTVLVQQALDAGQADSELLRRLPAWLWFLTR